MSELKTNEDMHSVVIYQINKGRDINNVLGLKLDDNIKKEGLSLNASIYDEVLNIKMPTNNIYDIYSRHCDKNTFHPLYRGEVMKTSDVIVIDDKAFYKEPNEFTKIRFNAKKTMKPNNLLDIVYVEPNMPAYKAQIKDELSSLQKAVKGYIEIVFNNDNTLIICNDEAKLDRLPGNRHLDDNGIIAGNFFVVGSKDEDFRSLDDNEISKYLSKYEIPESICQKQVEADMGFSIYVSNPINDISPNSSISMD